MGANTSFARKVRGLAWGAVGILLLGLGERTSIAEPSASLDPSDFADVLPVCSGVIRCHALTHVHPSGEVITFAAPAGLGAQDLQNAYKVNPNLATTSTIALVEAYNDATLEADLATYRQTYGLPPCTVANGCLKIVNQSGQ